VNDLHPTMKPVALIERTSSAAALYYKLLPPVKTNPLWASVAGVTQTHYLFLLSSGRNSPGSYQIPQFVVDIPPLRLEWLTAVAAAASIGMMMHFFNRETNVDSSG
jgi:hypothetical protein